jgi:hypothetical protein
MSDQAVQFRWAECDLNFRTDFDAGLKELVEATLRVISLAYGQKTHLRFQGRRVYWVKIRAMIFRFWHFLGWVVSAFRSRQDLTLENVALRQQLLALHAKRPRRRLRSG